MGGPGRYGLQFEDSAMAGEFCRMASFLSQKSASIMCQVEARRIRLETPLDHF